MKQNTFTDLLRNFETAYATGTFETELDTLAHVVVTSVLNKCIDPQKKNATKRENVTDSGMSQTLIDMKRNAYFDGIHLKNSRYAHDNFMDDIITRDGDIKRVVSDSDMKYSADYLASETLSDGYELVQEAKLAILEMAREHANLEEIFTVRRLDKRVVIRREDSHRYKNVDVTPIQEIYRSVRRAVSDSSSVKYDVNQKRTYVAIDIESETDVDMIDTVYYRSGKYSHLHGDSEESSLDILDVIEALNLTARQKYILDLRLQGNGNKAIASLLGVSPQAVAKTVKQIQAKAFECTMLNTSKVNIEKALK